MNDPEEWEPARARESRLSWFQDSDPCELAEWLVAGAALDRARDSLRKQQPPRNEVTIPSIDDDLDRLLEEIANYGYDFRHFVV